MLHWFDEPQTYGKMGTWLIFFGVNNNTNYDGISHKNYWRNAAGSFEIRHTGRVQKIRKVILFIFCMQIHLLYLCKTCLQAYLWCTVFKCLAKMYQLKSYLLSDEADWLILNIAVADIVRKKYCLTGTLMTMSISIEYVSICKYFETRSRKYIGDIIKVRLDYHHQMHLFT